MSEWPGLGTTGLEPETLDQGSDGHAVGAVRLAEPQYSCL